MRPVLLQLAPADARAFVIVAVVCALTLIALAAVVVHNAKRTDSDPLAALAGLLPLLVVISVFLFFWRANTIRVYTYGAMLLVAFAASWLWAVRDAPGFGFKPEQVTDIAMLGLALGVILARGFYVALNHADYGSDWQQPLRLWEGGLTFHGAVTGAVITWLAYTHFARLPRWRMGDFLAPYMMLGYAIGRVGCLLNGCCYGIKTSLPWGMRFLLAQAPATTSSFPVPVKHALNGEVWSRDRLHPAQLYAAALGLACYFALRWLRSRYHDFDGRAGRLVAGYFFFFGVERFITELFRRGVTAKPLLGPITEAQVVSLGLMLIGLVIYKWRMSLPPEPVPAIAEADEPPRRPPRSKKKKRAPNLVLPNIGKERAERGVGSSSRRGR